MRALDRSFARAAALAALLTVLGAAAASAATITIVNIDGANEGFNDPTVVAPVGGNPGTTIGQQRLNVFLHAAALWGAILPSNIEIRVRSAFNPLSCSATSGVLGSAGPISIVRDFAGAEQAGAWYHVALGNKLGNTDFAPGTDDISATFNSSIGQTGCLQATPWYYGLDGNEGTAIELLPVVLHELGHGLGFSTTTSGATGAYNGGFPSIYDFFLFDKTVGLHWNEMSQSQRAASAVNTGNLVWDGLAVRTVAPLVLDPRPELVVTAPASIAGDYVVGTAAFGPPPSSPGVAGEVVEADDGTAPNADACTALINGGVVSGRIALIDRGTCAFVTKVKNAQNAGAIGAIVVNNVAGPPIAMGGSDPTITIPSVMVSQADGAAIRGALSGGTVVASITVDAAELAGADGQGRVIMYTPSPFQSGSSVSHWDTSAQPNLLMEPAITASLSSDVDLTRQQMEDIGWLPHTTAVADAPGAGGPRLSPAAPTPFVERTTLAFELEHAARARIAVYDVRGAIVRTLADAEMPAGRHRVTWDGRDDAGRRLPAGIYLCRLSAAGREASRPVVLFP